MELHGKYTLIAEGVRGSLAKQLLAKFDLRTGVEPQKFGIGLKELWQVDPTRVHARAWSCTRMGWPLSETGSRGGSFMYHFSDNLVAIGFVVHLELREPVSLAVRRVPALQDPSGDRQDLRGRQAASPTVRAPSTRAACSRCRSSSFPGGALIGCSAGFVNVPRIKGSHNAMQERHAGGRSCVRGAGRRYDGGDELIAYPVKVKASWIWKDLDKVRNVKPALQWGTTLGTLYGGMDMWLHDLGIRVPWTHARMARRTTNVCGRPPSSSRFGYPKPDGVLSFDKLSSVFLSNTNHEEDQPVHLKLRDPSIPIAVNLPLYAEPAQRYCPAGVYEVVRRTTASRASRSTRRTASTARPATSRIRRRTSTGRRRRWRRPELSQYVSCMRRTSARAAVGSAASSIPATGQAQQGPAAPSDQAASRPARLSCRPISLQRPLSRCPRRRAGP